MKCYPFSIDVSFYKYTIDSKGMLMVVSLNHEV